MAEIIKYLVQFGVAGLMGVLWIWERYLSRDVTKMLSQAHQQLLDQKIEINTLIHIIEKNTQALERFDQTQQQLSRSLEDISVTLARKNI